MARRQLFRPKLAAWLWATLWGLVALVGFFQIVTPSAKWGVRLTGCLLLPVGVWLARCGYRLGLSLVDTAVEIRGFWRARSVPVADISRAYVGPGVNAVQPTRTLHLVFKSGEDRRYQEVSTSALWGWGSTKVAAAADAINESIRGA